MAGPGSDGEAELPKAFDGKVFNDPIHGHIEVDPLSVKIIDTPQFQRLRNIKQLGGGYWLYPGACHNRFEHSLGVYYLSGRLTTELQGKQPELDITPQDVLCVKIAGLCHDLGHGPFSHVFDQQFMKKAEPGCTWKHEDASIEMFDHLIKQNKINLAEYDLTQQDQTFIKELISPPKPKEPGSWPYKGRGTEKGFLYQIVSNSENGMDVDKWDYFARDSECTGLSKKFDHMRLIQSARVIKVHGKWQICYRDKEWLNVYDMFYTRACLHRQVYQHQAKVAVEMMITDALLEADRTPGEDNKKISGARKNMDAYTRLTDSIFHKILEGEGQGKARDILENLVTRKLYRLVGETEPGDLHLFPKSEASIAEGIFACALPEEKKKITLEDIAVNKVKVNYGMGEKNPVDSVNFWTKDKPNEAEPPKEKLSQMLPANFADNFVRVYCKKQDKDSIEAVKRCFGVFLKKEKGETTPPKPQGSRKPSPPGRPARKTNESKGPPDKRARRELDL
ncbi:deoxynucleoside triphosphate triphosphohydrolase SAMHD1-like [Branchiostoma lanceolatum]|uniref:deoxynucleoside triphosphate triphosphohydrolase SAMHD1-like n=1 Tax=Branchiostoma lanceolatum TaxID=7740 RepID=UPI00345599BC